MALRFIRKTGDSPANNTCPSLFVDAERGVFVVQGKRPGAGVLALLDLPDGEFAVEVPADVLREISLDAAV